MCRDDFITLISLLGFYEIHTDQYGYGPLHKGKTFRRLEKVGQRKVLITFADKVEIRICPLTTRAPETATWRGDVEGAKRFLTEMQSWKHYNAV